jgi:purine catabolism regulator
VSSPQRFTLRDVLAQESLGLRLITPATDEVLGRVVMGAHGTEAEHPVPWMQRDWALLITGVRMVGRPELQRQLIREVAAGGLAALGFGVGIDFDTVPEAVIEEAIEQDFPVFEIPLRTPFREIIAFVNRSLLSSDLHVMRRLTSMREFLLDALSDEDPQPLVVQRLASLLDTPVALLAPDGRVESASGPAAWEGVAELVVAGGDAVELEVGDRRLMAVPIADRGILQHWLVTLVPASRSPEAYVRPLLQTGAVVLGGLAGVRRVTRAAERAAHAAFLAELRTPEHRGDAGHQHRAATLGVDLRRPSRGVALAGVGSPPDLSDERLLDEAERVLRSASVRAVLAEERGDVLGILQGDGPEVRRALELVRARVPGVVAGVGRGVASAADLRRSLEDARLAVRGAGEADPIVFYEAFDLLTWLLSAADREGLRDKAAEVLGEVREDAALMAALESYLDHHLSAVRAAESLHLHPNSLRYRLARIEERLGRSLSDPETLAAVHLARRALDR